MSNYSSLRPCLDCGKLQSRPLCQACDGKRQEPTNPTVDNRIRRKQLKCPICPPNKAENAKRKAKHGSKKKRRPR